MKLLVTGGHVTPALVVIDELKKQQKNVEVIFVGRKFVSDVEHTESMEYKEVSARKVQFIHLSTGRLTRVLSWQSLKHFLILPAGFFSALKILLTYKPEAVLSFGGYIALPVAYSAWFLQIPVYTHEQTIHPGLANKLIAKVAKKVFISFTESEQFLPKEKTILTGNPVRPQVLSIMGKPFEIVKDKPVIYVTGGSLGSHSINVHIEKILPELLKKYTVIHQTGNVKEYNDSERLQQLYATLPLDLQKRYILRDHIFTNDLGYIFSCADIVISRAGANTFFELLRLQKPTIFVPLPWSSYQEQQKQADLFKNWQVGQIFNQENKSLELLKMIDEMISKLNYYKDNFSRITQNYPQNAAQTIINTICP